MDLPVFGRDGGYLFAAVFVHAFLGGEVISTEGADAVSDDGVGV